jgi:hypothetical protein
MLPQVRSQARSEAQMDRMLDDRAGEQRIQDLEEARHGDSRMW